MGLTNWVLSNPARPWPGLRPRLQTLLVEEDPSLQKLTGKLQGPNLMVIT
jgi:hypothetical protein